MFLSPGNCLTMEQERNSMGWLLSLSLIPLAGAPVFETWSKSHPERDFTANCTSKNETEPQHNWTRQIWGRIWSLLHSVCWRWQFFIGRLYLLPACMTASENMASSFWDFLGETLARYSPDDSHLVLETIFSYFYFSTCSRRVPAINVVSIPLLLASLGRSSMRPAIENRACTSFLLVHLPHSKAQSELWGQQQQSLSP